MNDILLLLPFATLIVLNLLPRSTRGVAWIPCLVVFALQTVFAATWPFVPHDWAGLEPMEKWLGISLSVDGLSVLLMGAAGLAGCAALIVSSGRAATPRTRFSFCNLFLVALAGMNGIGMARDLFTLYVFIEVTSVAAFILVSVRDTKQGFEGAWKYLVMSSVASVFMLVSLALSSSGRAGDIRRDGRRACGAHTHRVGRHRPLRLRPVRERCHGAVPRLACGRIHRGAARCCGLPGRHPDEGRRGSTPSCVSCR